MELLLTEIAVLTSVKLLRRAISTVIKDCCAVLLFSILAFMNAIKYL